MEVVVLANRLSRLLIKALNPMVEAGEDDLEELCPYAFGWTNLVRWLTGSR